MGGLVLKKESLDFSAACEQAVTAAEMKEIEKCADEAGLSYSQMMENAGSGAVDYIYSQISVAGKSILIFCGKGNNGGDGFVAARKLTEQGASVTLILAEGKPRTADAIKNRQICKDMSIPETDLGDWDGILRLTEQTDLIIDAIYGTGFHGMLREPVRQAARIINQSNAVVYALDIPSGLNADTGEADPDTIRADCTLVFHRPKPAHQEEAARIYCGEIICISIGIESVLGG